MLMVYDEEWKNEEKRVRWLLCYGERGDILFFDILGMCGRKEKRVEKRERRKEKRVREENVEKEKRGKIDKKKRKKGKGKKAKVHHDP